LEASRGNISLAARTLGISRQTLYRKMGARQS
jgi:transcriptional regulator of acetoin/glycerol metabolism